MYTIEKYLARLECTHHLYDYYFVDQQPKKTKYTKQMMKPEQRDTHLITNDRTKRSEIERNDYIVNDVYGWKLNGKTKRKHKHDSIRSDSKLNKIKSTNNTFLYVLHFVAESKLVPRITEELTIPGNFFLLRSVRSFTRQQQQQRQQQKLRVSHRIA